MISSLRHCVAILVAGLAWSGTVVGQESPSSGSAPASGSGSSGSSPVFGSGSGSSSSFSLSTSEAPAAPAETGRTETGATPEGSSASGLSTPSFGAEAPKTSQPSFTVPGFYGQGSTTFFGGSGRLARPRFRAGFTFGIGYDDNLSNTPSDNTPTILPGFSQFVDANGNTVTVQPTETKTIVVQTGTQFLPGGLQPQPVFETFTVEVPVDVDDTVIPADERQGSLFTRTGLLLEMQRYTPRSLFTLNAVGSLTYYLDKGEEPIEYNGNFTVSYLYRLTPRLQVTAQANTAYISQPDLSRPNTPQVQTQGDLINALGRLDVEYRITPRLSLSLTSNYSGYRYTEVTEQTGDFDEYTFGIEARYLWKPRWTLLAELRHSITTYLNRTDLDGTTDFLLVGTQFILSPRLSGTLRIGEAIKTFDMSSSAQSAPYVESTVSYRSTARSSVTWNNRFGFEEPQSPNQERLVYRASVAYSYMFSPHLQGSAAVNMVHEITTTEGANTDSTQDTFEATLGLEHNVTRNFTVNGGYTFTLSNTNTGLSDYYRNRIFVGGQYTF